MEDTLKVDNSKWYVLRVISGKEKKIKERIEREIEINKWTEAIKQIFLPTEKVFKILKGKKIIRERNFFPGYIMIEIDPDKFNDNILDSISNLENVIHFLGKGNPVALRKNEVQKMLGKMDEMSDSEFELEEPYIIGETIKIIDGPFNTFNGVIEEVNNEKKKLVVNVKIFGRSTPVELSFMQVEKSL